MGKKPIVSVTYENERILKKQLTLLKMCVTFLLCGPLADLWQFYGFLCKRFSLYIKVYLQSLPMLVGKLELNPEASWQSAFGLCLIRLRYFFTHDHRTIPLWLVWLKMLNTQNLHFLPLRRRRIFLSLSEGIPPCSPTQQGPSLAARWCQGQRARIRQVPFSD